MPRPPWECKPRWVRPDEYTCAAGCGRPDVQPGYYSGAVLRRWEAERVCVCCQLAPLPAPPPERHPDAAALHRRMLDRAEAHKRRAKDMRSGVYARRLERARKRREKQRAVAEKKQARQRKRAKTEPEPPEPQEPQEPQEPPDDDPLESMHGESDGEIDWGSESSGDEMDGSDDDEEAAALRCAVLDA